ncbi:small multidrug efflux protein [Microbacterium sp.]|uniref:small multidrug efflux protein n=1 Tax=Microbacterium sp. TaxID=51671 RepID=UPI003C757701
MNPIQELINNFQNLVGQVPELIQPLVVALAGAIPFIEGEGASPIGVVGGIHPVIAGIAAAAGNFLGVMIVVLVSARTRAAVVSRRAARREPVTVGGHAPGAVITLEQRDEDSTAETAAPPPAEPESKGRQRFRRWLVRFGVPGASILGPLAIPTHFTAAMLAASGTARSWILLWQAVAIVLWTSVTTTLVWLALSAVVTA